MINQLPKRILIIEDEVLVGMYLEDLLTEMGHHVVGPATRIEEAIGLARDSDIDFAILDVNLGGTPSFPAAAILRERGIRFVFATGYGDQGVPAEYMNEPILRKPYELENLERAVEKGLQAVSLVIPRI